MMPNVDDVYGSGRYLRAGDLPQGKQVRAVIERVVLERLKNDSGEQDKLVVGFVGKKKALVLNATNANRIAEQTGHKDWDYWPGWTITIYPTMVDFGSKRVPAIRVSDLPGSAFAPGPPPPPQRARHVEPPPPPPAAAPVEEWIADEDAPEVKTAQSLITADDIPF